MTPKSKTFNDEDKMGMFCRFLEEKEISYRVEHNSGDWEVRYPNNVAPKIDSNDNKL